MSDSIITSAKSESWWAEQVSKTFKPEFIIRIHDPCVFRVSKSVRETKPEAYAPQKFGLGPYHHLRPEFHVLQRKKITAVEKFLKPEQFENFQTLVVDKVVAIEPIIRSCYDEYIDISGTTLSMILAIDGVCLLWILTAGGGDTVGISEQSGRSDQLSEFVVQTFGGDLFMLENQVPSVVVNEIRSALTHNEDYPMLSNAYLSICKAHSPLELAEQKEFTDDTESPHLLAYMYHLIVNKTEPSAHHPQWKKLKKQIIKNAPDRQATSRKGLEEALLSVVEKAPDLQAAIKNGAANSSVFKKFNQLGQNYEQIYSVFKKLKPQPAEEIDIPSASRLHWITKVEFKKSAGGIRGVHYDKAENALYLPEITVRGDSEVILRNLVAYEAATATPESNLELTKYVDLMCGIVDTEKDVELLMKAGIIKKDRLKPKEIADTLNRIKKSTYKSYNKCEIDNAIEDLKKKYGGILWVKAYESAKKFTGISWKLISFSLGVLCLILLMLQPLLQIFGFNWFG